MCGVAGYAGIDVGVRDSLVWALGVGIDTRGGHAIGFASVGDSVRVHTQLGMWGDARARFIAAAAARDVSLMHARFATCGSKDDVRNAHPFVVKREGRTLYGAHNGMVWNADVSARRHGRKLTVDSREVYELLADGEDIGELDGYGVLTWAEQGDRGVYLAKASLCADLVVREVVGGGYVYASTDAILEDALSYAGLEPGAEIELDVGVVYRLDARGTPMWGDRSTGPTRRRSAPPRCRWSAQTRAKAPRRPVERLAQGWSGVGSLTPPRRAYAPARAL